METRQAKVVLARPEVDFINKQGEKREKENKVLHLVNNLFTVCG